MEKIHLLGLDFGSTTCSALVASARLLPNSITGRMEMGQAAILYRSALAFTPCIEDCINEQALSGLLDRWLDEAGVDTSSFAAGGVIITGLAAQARNVATIKTLVRTRVGKVLFATADDPCLESWLAFMGSCVGLSRLHPETSFLNLDIGGGTTNLALGIDGEVLRTGCLFAGARHIQFVPGTYCITALSSYATRLLHDLKIDKTIGDTLSPVELQTILDFYIALIEAAVGGAQARLNEDPFRYHIQVPFVAPPGAAPVITLSGGVGELIYRRLGGVPLPSTTAFGDLGIDLAKRLLQSPLLSHDFTTHVPANFGHATVFGMCLFGTEISGTTLYLPDAGILPLADLPILARMDAKTSKVDMMRALELVGRSAAGGCIDIALEAPDAATIKRVGTNLANALRERELPGSRVLVLFVSQNVGKSLGCYASDWGRLPVKLIVIDELETRNARFASLGAIRANVVPVSLYGLQ